MDSPEKKKVKLNSPVPKFNESERDIECVENSNIDVKTEEEDIQAKKRENFVFACEQVSFKAYYDYYTRLHLIYHHDIKTDIDTSRKMPSYAEESFKIEMKTNTWYEALEVCRMSITPIQYLSANVLRGVTEIMLNAHEDDYAGFSINYLLEKCQQILSRNFSAHPPCMNKSLRKCYNSFLTAPMDLRKNTFSNRTEFGCEKGIVKYCFNRLEYEFSLESKDGPFIDKNEHIPEEMKQSVKGLHWQKEKFEIFELLERPKRIERLMAVLGSVIELLQFDLADWHSRYTSNLGGHIMRSHKPLMAFVLWSNNILYTGVVNENSQQILRLFVYFVHLQYPEEYIRIVATWLNIMVETFYICETNSNSDYPNPGKYCLTFANVFYNLISSKNMPYESEIKILERIYPNYMRHLIGVLQLKRIMSSKEDCIINILIEFIKSEQWKEFPENNDEIIISKKLFYPAKNNVKNKLHYLSKICKEWKEKLLVLPERDDFYPKFHPLPKINENIISRKIVIHLIYITLEAYLDAYNFQSVQETLDYLNKNLESDRIKINIIQNSCSYSVSESFIKRYRENFQRFKELMLMFNEKQNCGKVPDKMSIFKNLGLFDS